MDYARNDKDCNDPACMCFYVVNTSMNQHNVIVHVNRALGVDTDDSFTSNEQITKIKNTIMKGAITLWWRTRLSRGGPGFETRCGRGLWRCSPCPATLRSSTVVLHSLLYTSEERYSEGARHWRLSVLSTGNCVSVVARTIQPPSCWSSAPYTSWERNSIMYPSSHTLLFSSHHMINLSQPAPYASRTYVVLLSSCPLLLQFSRDLFLWIHMSSAHLHFRHF